ncbi:MAG: glycosyltransferase [Bacteroidales bacterium]|nr:glycosyltransferase [Bacteroidales bacterium]
MIKNLFEIELQTPTDWIWLFVGILLLLALGIQLYYLFGVYLKLLVFNKKDVKSTTDPVSVIICARNEAENLKHFLPSVLNQFYPEFEVIVVNDGSTDQTAEVLAEIKRQYPLLYVTEIEHRDDYPKGKKLAQTIGIKAAKYDQLLFTDADCEPASPNWIRQMQSNFLNQTEIVLGYAPYFPEKGLLNKWIRTDTLYIAMQYLSLAIQKKPYLGVGRNMSYRRSLFFKNKGFASHLHLVSGDDDLFINETSTAFNTAIEIHPESFTYSKPSSSWKQWTRQKRRHLTTSKVYKKSNKRRLTIELLSREAVYLLSILLLSLGFFKGYVISILFIRFISYGIIFKLVMNRLKEKKLFLLSFIYDFLWPFLGAYLIITTKHKKKPSRWK